MLNDMLRKMNDRHKAKETAYSKPAGQLLRVPEPCPWALMQNVQPAARTTPLRSVQLRQAKGLDAPLTKSLWPESR